MQAVSVVIWMESELISPVWLGFLGKTRIFQATVDFLGVNRKKILCQIEMQKCLIKNDEAKFLKQTNIFGFEIWNLENPNSESE